MGIEESKIVGEVLKVLAKNTQKNYKATLKQFLQFVNSEEGLSKTISIEDLVELAKSDVKEIQKLIDLFYKWLQNEKVEGYPLRGKGIKSSSAYQLAYGYLLGFFVNIDITFQRRWRKTRPKPERKQALKKDKIYTFFNVDEKTMTIRFNRERMRQFLTNMKLRDVAITLALLSSSQDSGDLFKLNVGDIREQTNNRIFWEGYRGKSKVLFRTFISKEATKFVRRYIQQERQESGNKEPLFVYTRNIYEEQPDGKMKIIGEEKKRMTSTNLSSIYRDAARRMGIKWENGEHNPLRPKRMRHLFRTACDTAGITELYINAFMGHTNHQGQDYSELSKTVLELEYLRVEPFLTVYGEVEEALEIKQDIQSLRTDLDSLMRNFTKNVEVVAHDLFDKWMREQLEDDREAIKELQKWREEFTRRYYEDVKQKRQRKFLRVKSAKRKE